MLPSVRRESPSPSRRPGPSSDRKAGAWRTTRTGPCSWPATSSRTMPARRPIPTRPSRASTPRDDSTRRTGDDGFAIPVPDASTYVQRMAVRNGEALRHGRPESRRACRRSSRRCAPTATLDLGYGVAGIAELDDYFSSNFDPLVAVDGEGRAYVHVSEQGRAGRKSCASTQVVRATPPLVSTAPRTWPRTAGHSRAKASLQWRARRAVHRGRHVCGKPRVRCARAIGVARLAGERRHRAGVTAGKAIVYYNAALDHYFLTANPAEQALLDNGVTEGWRRTATSFGVVTTARRGPGSLARMPLLRAARGAPRLPFLLGGAATSARPSRRSSRASWLLETAARRSTCILPIARPGQCARGSERVFRAFNNRADANHYYDVFAERAGRLDLRRLRSGRPPHGVLRAAPLIRRDGLARVAEEGARRRRGRRAHRRTRDATCAVAESRRRRARRARRGFDRIAVDDRQPGAFGDRAQDRVLARELERDAWRGTGTRERIDQRRARSRTGLRAAPSGGRRASRARSRAGAQADGRAARRSRAHSWRPAGAPAERRPARWRRDRDRRPRCDIRDRSVARLATRMRTATPSCSRANPAMQARGMTRRRARDGEPQLAAFDVAQLAQRVVEPAEQREQLPAVGVSPATRLGEAHAAADRLEERGADRLGQLAYLRGHGGLGEVQLLAGAGEARMPRARLEHGQLRQRPVTHVPAYSRLRHRRGLRCAQRNDRDANAKRPSPRRQRPAPNVVWMRAFAVRQRSRLHEEMGAGATGASPIGVCPD